MRKLLILLSISTMAYAQSPSECVTPPNITRSTTVTTSSYDEACQEIDLNEGFETADNIEYTALIGNTGNGESGGALVGMKANDPSAQISLLALPKGNEVWLRWIPLSQQHWYDAARIGYKVYREKKTGTTWEAPVLITTTSVVPSDSTGWYDSPDSLKSILYYATRDTITFSDSDASDQLYFQYFAASNIYNRRYDLAILSGHGFKDAGALPNETYRYRIEAVIGSTTISSGVALEVTNSSGGAFPQSVVDLTKENTDQKPKVNISWGASGLRRYYGSYNVQRAAGTGAFTTLNTLPIVYNGYVNDSNHVTYAIPNISIADTLPNVTQTYKYKIVGNTYFGEQVEFVVKEISVKKNYYFQPVIDSVYKVNTTSKAIKWNIVSYRGGSNFDNDLSTEGWSVYVSDSSNKSNFKLLSSGIAKTSRTFTFTKALLATKLDTSRSHYFQMRIKTIEGDTLFSNAFFVLPTYNAPPAKPTGLTLSYIDDQDLGKKIVTLTWNANTEKDLEGYKVTRRIGLTDSLVVISGAKYKKVGNDKYALSPILDGTSLVCKDTLALNVTYPDIYYGLSALDNFSNESDTMQTKLSSIDNIRPFPPSIRKVKPYFDNGASTYHAKISVSYSTDKTARHILYISDPIDFSLGKSPVPNFPESGIIEYTSTQRDTLITSYALQSNKSYYFSFVAIDPSGNVSCISELDEKPNYNKCAQIVSLDILGTSVISKKEVISTFSKKTTDLASEIVVQWSLLQGFENSVKEFEIYKSEYEPGTTVLPKESLYKIIKKGIYEFKDFELKPGLENKYFIRAVLNDGSLSQWKVWTSSN